MDSGFRFWSTGLAGFRLIRPIIGVQGLEDSTCLRISAQM